MWLETITVRTPQLPLLEAALSELIDGLERLSPAPSVATYRRDPPMSDLSVHLQWAADSKYSRHCGIQLAAALGEFGTVDHAVWQSLSTTPTERFTPVSQQT